MRRSREAGNSRHPDLQEELRLLTAGYSLVAGVDEAGRGPWAGPVCAAAVVLPLNGNDLPSQLTGVRDSKQLSASRRELLLPRILAVAKSFGVGWASPAEIDTWGIVPATRRAMIRAVDRLNGNVDVLLIDYVELPDAGLPQRSLPKADSLCLSVAAASILAKVTRDRLMIALDSAYPGYGFAAHKGYGTKVHIEAIRKYGPCKIHRRSFIGKICHFER